MTAKNRRFSNLAVSPFGLVGILSLYLLIVSLLANSYPILGVLLPPSPSFMRGIEWADEMSRVGAYEMKIDSVNIQQPKK